MGISKPKADGVSKTTCVIRAEFPARQSRLAPQAEPGAILPFKRKHAYTAAGISVRPGSDPNLLLVRINGAIRYDSLVQGLRSAGLTLKQDRDGLLIT